MLVSLARVFLDEMMTNGALEQLELDPDEGPCILERMTFTYGLGNQHGLFAAMKAAQAELPS
jgi:m7GpppX diphosphatase